MKYMRRFLAIFAFVSGGVAAEMVRPVYCSLLHVARVQQKRPEV